MIFGAFFAFAILGALFWVVPSYTLGVYRGFGHLLGVVPEFWTIFLLLITSSLILNPYCSADCGLQVCGLKKI